MSKQDKKTRTIKYIMDLMNEKENQYLELKEEIDTDKLHYIVSNPEQFINQFDKTDWEKGYDPFKICKNYLNKSIDGVVKVLYNQKRGVGRFFANKSLSLQSISKEIRHTISRGYIDIDVVNAHPTFLYFICKKLSINCPKLKQYVKRRNECLEGVPNGKKVFLSILNGGTKDYNELEEKTPFITDFKNEIENIHILLCEKFSDKYLKVIKEREEQKINFNHRGSFVNKLLCDFENKVLLTIYEFYENPVSAVLCFDGLMLKDDIQPRLKECEKYIKLKLKINIKLKVKPFDLAFNMGLYQIEKYIEPSYDQYFDYKKFVGKKIYLDKLEHWTNNNIALIDVGGKTSILTKNRKMDRLTKQYQIFFKQIKTDEFLKTMKIKCSVINEKFDKELYDKVKNGEIKEKELTYEESLRVNKYLYTFLDKYFKHIIEERTIKTYNGLEFLPYLKRKGVPELFDYFNVFTGFPLEDEEEGTEEMKGKNLFEGSPLYNHIKNEMCNGEEGEFNHLLDCIADMIQAPAKMRGNAHLFISEQGTGKGLLAFFIQKLLGINHCITFDKISDYFSNFNVDKSNKIFKVIEEVSDKGEAFYKADILKADLTKTRERIEPKGLDPYTLNHYARYFFFSNNSNAIYIENSDRRYTIHHIKNTYANNKKYFKPMWDDVEDDRYCKNAFEFFSNRKYEELSVMEAYVNKAKKEHKIDNLSSTLKIIYELIENDFMDLKRDNRGYCKVIDFKSYCKMWYEDNGGKFKLSTMKTQLKKFNLEEQRVYDKNKKLIRVYNFNGDYLQELFRKHLKDDELTFDIIEEKNNGDFD